MAKATALPTKETMPRFLRASTAPAYLGMCREEFNKTVRPHVREFPIGKQGAGFDRIELDQWADSWAESMAAFKRDRQKPTMNDKGKVKPGVTNRTVNIALQRVVRILNLCQRKWRDAEKRPWLDSVPMISMLEEAKSSRKPYPMSWAEQSMLFSEIPDHLLRTSLYKVNTGCREQEVCKLQWDWEIRVPELGTRVFLIPADFGGRSERSDVKNGDERLVVLNKVAMSVSAACTRSTSSHTGSRTNAVRLRCTG